MTEETRERDLSQSEESEDEEVEKFRSIQSIYDETNLMCNESRFLLAEEPSSYSSTAKQKVWRDTMQEEILAILKNKTLDCGQIEKRCQSSGSEIGVLS